MEKKDINDFFSWVMLAAITLLYCYLAILIL